MAWTNLETIKKHLQSSPILAPTIFNEPVLLTITESQQMAFNSIDENSETVKIIRQIAPSQEGLITLNGTTPFDLSPDFIVPGTVLVAPDLTFASLFIENDDYVIDYRNGTVERASTGTSIGDGSQVYVWYLPFIALTKGADYNIDYGDGKLQRRGGSSIPSKATVYVDYTHSQTSITDDIIEETIIEAEHFMAQRLKGGFTFSTVDQTLKAAATFLTLNYLCLSQAMKFLNNTGLEDSDNLADGYQDLADKYFTTFMNNFSKFTTFNPFNSGGVIQNRYSRNRPSRSMRSPTIHSGIRKR